MRIGLYGGTFDPIHLGHLILAEQCREQHELDEVWFIPAGDPPHKSGRDITDSLHRVMMVELATASNEHFRVDRRELTRTGRSYSVDTLQQIADEHPSDKLFFLVGSDSLRDFPTWHRPERIAQLATIVAVNRGEDTIGNVDAIVGTTIAESVQLTQIPGIEISSSGIRERVKTGRAIRYFVPTDVEDYIESHRLYH